MSREKRLQAESPDTAQKKWIVDDLIFENVVTDLGSIPFHAPSSEVQRFAPADFPFPVHLAIHQIKIAETTPAQYVEAHSHEHPELNILIGEPGALVYRFELDGEVREVRSPATVWIPAGVKHAASAVSGTGHYVCMILADTKDVFPQLAGDSSR